MEFDDDYDKVAIAKTNKKLKTDSYNLQAKFDNQKEWKHRGKIEIFRDSLGKAQSINVINEDVPNNIEQEFKNACSEGKLY